MEYDSEDETDSTSNDEETCSKNKEMDKKKRGEFTNIVLDAEMKELIIRESKIAQDLNGGFYISAQTSYEIFHDVLKEFMIKKYNKKPTQTDNLAYLLLLGYPEHKIRDFTSMKDLKLAFIDDDEESDFTSIGFIRTDEPENTCICNEPICNVHRFQNKYSGINFNIGSKCNNRYGLINKKNPEYKSNDKKLKDFLENEKERREGLPEGFYEKERQYKKQKKEEDKLKKLEEKESKKREKELKNLNKKQPGSFKIKNCAVCDKEGIYKTNEIKICSACVPSKVKLVRDILNIEIRRNEVYKECVNCNSEFIDVKNNTQLCDVCDEKWCLEKCKMCPEKFLKQKTVNDLYCLDCDEKITNCIDCKRDILKPSERCGNCDHKFKNNLDSIICKYCKKEEFVKKGEVWKKNCKDCYKKLVITKNCITDNCYNTVTVMPDESWKTKCRTCF